jgi:hypothetical protein
MIWFQWGYCPGYGPRPESTYRVGDAIRWRTAPDGTVPAWTYFREDGQHRGANLGDPVIERVVLRDHAQFWLRESCPHCGAAWGGAAVEIEGGVIRRGWLTMPGELDTANDIFVREPDGRLVARPEWNDARMRILELPSGKHG